MIVLTGPTGNVGAEVCKRVAEEADPDTYRVAAHHPDGVRFRYGERVPVVGFDYDDRSTWPDALRDVHTLFLLFPLPGPHAVRTRMIPFIDAAVAAGCRHIVYVSVPGADRLTFVPHYDVERHIERSGVDHTFLRCGYFMQNLCRAVSTHGVDIAERGEIFIPAGNARITLLDARDVAELVTRVFADTAGHRNRSYLLTGSETLRFDQVAMTLSGVLRRPVRYARPNFARFWWRLYRRGVSWDTLGFMTLVYLLTRTGRNALRTDELPALLGRNTTTLRQWAQDHRWRFERRQWS